MLRLGIVIVLWVGFVIEATRLRSIANRYLRSPDRLTTGDPLFDPTKYSSAGESARSRAAQWSRIGGLILIVLTVLFLA